MNTILFSSSDFVVIYSYISDTLKIMSVPDGTPKTLSSHPSPGFDINDTYVNSLLNLLFR